MKKTYLLIALVAAALAAPAAHAADPDREDRKDRYERSETRDRARSPYTNRAQFERRQIRDAIREAENPRRGTYRFRRARERRPN